jgi:hypothetical protein
MQWERIIVKISTEKGKSWRTLSKRGKNVVGSKSQMKNSVSNPRLNINKSAFPEIIGFFFSSYMMCIQFLPNFLIYEENLLQCFSSVYTLGREGGYHPPSLRSSKDDRKHGVRIHLKVLLCCGKLEMLVLLHNRTDVLCSPGYGIRPQISTVEDQAQIF